MKMPRLILERDPENISHLSGRGSLGSSLAHLLCLGCPRAGTKEDEQVRFQSLFLG